MVDAYCPIDIVTASWTNHSDRLDYLDETWTALLHNLRPGHHPIQLYCSSESEGLADRGALEAICRKHGATLSYHEGAPEIGRNMNRALALGSAPLVMFLNEDYRLQVPLEIEPAAELLQADPQYVMVKFSGCLTPRLEEIPGTPFRRADPKAVWTYSDDPQLRHRERFLTKVGPYDEDLEHGGAEWLMNLKLRSSGLLVAMPADDFFSHFGARSAAMEFYQKKQQSKFDC